jgi:hypothetical protein
VQQTLSDIPQPQGDTPVTPSDTSAPAPVWLQRLSLVVLVLFCFLVGSVLAIIPWSPRYWDDNGWLMAHPAVHLIVSQGWVRGIVSGFGLIDIWIGVSELLHYRDFRG